MIFISHNICKFKFLDYLKSNLVLSVLIVIYVLSEKWELSNYERTCIRTSTIKAYLYLLKFMSTLGVNMGNMQ